MSEKKELKQEELDKVTGGTYIDDELFNKITIIKRINIYETAYHIGEDVCVSKEADVVDYAGTLVKSWEGKRNRYIKLAVKYSSIPSEVGKEIEIPLVKRGDVDKFDNYHESQVWLISFK